MSITIKRTSIKCSRNGTWKAKKTFSCKNPCPELYNVHKRSSLKVRHSWTTGFEVLIKFKPKMDLNDWTVVFFFDQQPGVSLKYYSWETQVTVSANGQLATLTSMPWNIGLKFGDNLLTS